MPRGYVLAWQPQLWGRGCSLTPIRNHARHSLLGALVPGKQVLALGAAEEGMCACGRAEWGEASKA